MCSPVRTASWEKELPASHTTSPVVASKIVQPRVPPFQSPSLAVTTWSSPTQPIASGSRGVSEIEPLWSMVPSSAVSMPSTDSLPALKMLVTSPVRPSMIATPLFSWNVSATWPRELMLTYSGSRSSGVSRPAERAASTSKSTRRADHVFGSPARSMSCRKPVGGWGRSPSSPPGGVASSSRWFSIAIAANEPSGLMAIESGWPPRSMLCTGVRSLTRTMSTRPDGFAKSPPVVSMTTSTTSATAATEVGWSSALPSSSSDSVPCPTGLTGSATSTKPMRLAAASV